MLVKIGLFTILLCVFPYTTDVALSAKSINEGSYVVTGTLKELDLPKLRGKITTNRDRTVAFTIKNPNLFKGLSVGQHIAVRLNDHGQAIKVMETTIPELPSPE